jgi:hypothetical protein
MKIKSFLNLGLYTILMLALVSAYVEVSAFSQGASAGSYVLNPFVSPDWIGESNYDGNIFGASVASAGDVNNDGYDDIIVGSPYYSNGQHFEGRAYVYFGSASGLSLSPSWTFESNLVDCQIGWSVASAGDVNGDGFDEVMVASEYCSAQGDPDPYRRGKVYLFYGSSSGPSTTPGWELMGAGEDESLGWSIASAGDINGDNYDDVIIGAPWASYPQGHEGRAYVFYGSNTGLSTTADWTEESDWDWSGFGSSVASAGDVNGDGYMDVVIGQFDFSGPEEGEGRVYVYHGSSSGLANDPAWCYENNHADTNLGESVAGAGDVNGDGYADVVVGGFHYANPDEREGVVYLFLGSASGLSANPDWTGEGNQAYAEYGQSVASAGDVNLDGYDDVLVGAPWYMDVQSFEGQAFLFYGSESGLRADITHTYASGQDYANLGYSVASAGDVNGDGAADIILGAQNYDHGQDNEGCAFAFYGHEDLDYGLYLPLITR